MDKTVHCTAEVWEPVGRDFYPCQRRAVRDGYCTQHHPNTKRAREEKERLKQEAKERGYEAKRVRDAAVKALARLGARVAADIARDKGSFEDAYDYAVAQAMALGLIEEGPPSFMYHIPDPIAATVRELCEED